ncbi:MAG: sulfurtransferase [Bacillus sp. (in: firmicutes)]
MIMEKEAVLELIKDKSEAIRLIDCRFDLKQKQLGKELYDRSHLPQAVFFDLEKDLSAPAKEHGGRHPLPEISSFISKLEQAGITNDTTVVAYDSGTDAFAARFCWLMEYVGHTKTFLLNGGFNHWVEVGYEMDTEVPEFPEASFEPLLKEGILASYTEVKALAENGEEDKVLIDSREHARYAGKWEPIDHKAGHIPKAINKPWTEGVVEGEYADENRQKERFAEIDREKEIIVYCGSGVTAAPNYLALKQAGFENVKLYVGSFSDWISYDENKVETTE